MISRKKISIVKILGRSLSSSSKSAKGFKMDEKATCIIKAERNLRSLLGQDLPSGLHMLFQHLCVAKQLASFVGVKLLDKVTLGLIFVLLDGAEDGQSIA